MATFTLRIVSPSKKVFDGDVSYCGITTSMGSMGIKAHHEPFMAVLVDGSDVVYRRENGVEETIQVKHSILSFGGDNVCTLVFSE